MTKEDKKLAIVEYFGDVPIYKYAAMYVGVDEDTLIRWRKEDTDFADKLHQARASWVRSKVKKAKIEFALERMEKDIFGQKVEVESGPNLVRTLLEAYGIKAEGESDDTKTDGAVQSPSDSQT